MCAVVVFADGVASDGAAGVLTIRMWMLVSLALCQVMHPNGVSHMEVGNDQEGVDGILQWLSYVPKTASSAPPARPVTDPVEREVRP